jgi:hypothetical protein
MKLREAQTLKPGQSIEALVGSPCGGGSRWDPARKTFVGVPLPSGEAVTFVRLIPKVRVIKNGPWNDCFDQMLLCQRSNGDRAWINIRNALRVKECVRKAA